MFVVVFKFGTYSADSDEPTLGYGFHHMLYMVGGSVDVIV